uniref:Uncharacterized protein n=1 Tax=Lepeophtheirus salmonis TaxID=72036 RepID=A0A0K2UNB0_LEPSM
MGWYLVSRGPHFLWPGRQVVLQPLLGLFRRLCRHTMLLQHQVHVRVVRLDPW